MSKEKSQFENIAMPTAQEATAKKKTGPSLPAGFALGQSLEQEQLVPRAESVKSFMPKFQPLTDRMAQEEKEKKAQVEKEGMNYDLYLLIKEKLAEEFVENLEKSKENSTLMGMELYRSLGQSSLSNFIRRNPELYTPNPKDLEFIAKKLRELFPKIEKSDYSNLGVFLNTFILAYFNSIPQGERRDLKLYLSNTKNLDYIGAELSFGELEVEEAGNSFGHRVNGEAVLKAKKVGNYAGCESCGKAQVLITEETGHSFGQYACGEVFLKAKKAENYVGFQAAERARIEIEEAGNFFGREAEGRASLKAKRVGNNAAFRIESNAQVTITESYGSIGGGRRDNSQIILPDGRVLGPRDQV